MAVKVSSFTVSEAAGRLACTGQTIRTMIHAGRLPAYQVGREFRILAEDLEALRVPVPASGEGGAYAQ